jgi:cyclic nucleotide gated channel beta 1
MRNRLEIPPTPSSSGSLSGCTPQHQNILFGTKNNDDDDVVVIEAINDEKCLVGKQLKTLAVEGPAALEENVKIQQHSRCSIFCCCAGPVMDPQGRFYISWLFIVTLSFLYNAFVIPLRTSFPFQTIENQQSWFLCDIIADVIYLADLLFIKHRTMYLYEGFWIRDRQLTRKNYMKKLQFKM